MDEAQSQAESGDGHEDGVDPPTRESRGIDAGGDRRRFGLGNGIGLATVRGAGAGRSDPLAGMT
jgi:hypothetical protein